MSMESVYIEIHQSINTGAVFSLQREKLEQFVAALSMANAYTHFSASEFPGTCETVRMALSMKVSEHANLQAKNESRIALIVSSAALAVGIVSAFSALWPLAFPSPTQVYATPQNPVYANIIEQSPTQKGQIQVLPMQSIQSSSKPVQSSAMGNKK